MPTVYRYPAPLPLATFDGVKLKSFTVNLETGEMSVVAESLLGTASKTARTITGGPGSLAAFEAAFTGLAGTTLTQKLLAFLVSVGRIPSGGTLEIT